MAICSIIDDPGRTPEQWELISAHVGGSGPVPPEGCRLAMFGTDRVVTVWDSPADRDSFLDERLAPAYEAAGRSLDEATRTQFDVEMLIAGDLAGMAQQPAGPNPPAASSRPRARSL